MMLQLDIEVVMMGSDGVGLGVEKQNHADIALRSMVLFILQIASGAAQVPQLNIRSSYAFGLIAQRAFESREIVGRQIYL